MLRTGLLWPLVLAHWLIDFISFLQPPGFTYSAPWDVLITVSITLLFTAYGLYVMLHEKQVKRMPAWARTIQSLRVANSSRRTRRRVDSPQTLGGLRR